MFPVLKNALRFLYSVINFWKIVYCTSILETLNDDIFFLLKDSNKILILIYLFN